MKKVAINRCYGGFGLSKDALILYCQKKFPKAQISAGKDEWGWECVFVGDDTFYDNFDDSREDPILIEVIEELGDKASERWSQLRVVEIPDDVDYIITDYDGMEKIEEVHREWY